MKSFRAAAFLAAGLAGGFAALLAPGAANAQDSGPAKLAVGQEAQQDLMVTVYNNGYGLVREVRTIKLPAGTVELEFRDVAEMIDPTSVAFKSLTAADEVGILEQNYRYDLLSPETVMNKFIGKPVTYTIRGLNPQELAVRKGTLLSTNNGVVVKFKDEIVINPEGSVSFGDVPPDLLARPTLLWLLQSEKAGEHKAETSYLTNGMNWKADYVTVLNAEDTKLDLTGWVTLENNSGAAYKNAALKLVAGEVQRVEEVQLGRKVQRMHAPEAAMAADMQFAEKSFFEYHLYTLGRRTTVGNRETKQITLLEGAGVPAKKIFIVDSPMWAMEGGIKGAEKRPVNVMVEFENKKDHGLGIALPKGRVRVYKADTDASLQLIGEDMIEHTPKDEKLRLRLGEAFDIVAERSQTNYSKLGSNTAEFSYSVKIRNHKTEAATVDVLEHVYGDWKLTQESHKHEKVDSRTIRFSVPVAADGEATLTYTARVTW